MVEKLFPDLFLKYQNYGGETIPRLVFKISKLSISLINSLKFHTVCFYDMPS